MKIHPAILTTFFLTTFFLTTFFFAIGCSSTATTSGAPRGQNQPAPPPAMIGHIIFIQLHDSSDYFELINDADWMLGTIPSVATYAAGKHLNTGNPAVAGNYDLAIYLGFDSEQNLRNYVASSQQIRFAQKWDSKFKSKITYDMIDWPTTRYGVRN